MTEDRPRRLAAVMFTDVVGFTALMRNDEETARTVQLRHQDAVEEALAEHGGELLQYLGDGSLSIFPSAVRAVFAAAQIQNRLGDQIPLRIGIHQGEVAFDDRGIYGDSVNVAARVMGLGTAGSVVVSEEVHDEMKNQRGFSTRSLGRFELKNVEFPLEVYAVEGKDLAVPTREDVLVGTGAPQPESRALKEVDSGPSGRDREDLRLQLQKKLSGSFTGIELIGEGGMGSVFGARDVGLDRRVAIKVLSPALASNPEARERFRREARALAALIHSNLVSVYSVDELSNGIPFFVMEYVGERSLADLINPKTPVSIAEAQRILEHVARGLLAIHQRELVHRDIKPANILLDGTGRVLVSDFGIAVGEGTRTERLTTGRGLIGSPEYMSPEQASGDPVDHRSDLYSFGIMAFELLAGTLPFEADTYQALIVKHITEDPPILSDRRPDCPPYLVQLVARCLEKERSVRLQSAEQVLETLVTAQEGGTLGTPTLGREVAESRKQFVVFLTASVVAVALDIVFSGDVAWSLIPLAASGVYGVSRAGRFWVDGLTAKGILGLEETKFELLNSQSGRIQPFRQLVRQCRAERALLLSAYAELARSEQADLPRLSGVVDHLVARASRSARELHSLRPDGATGQIASTGSSTFSSGRTQGEVTEAQDRLGEDVSGVVRLLRDIRNEVAELGESGRTRGTDRVRAAVAAAVAYLGEEMLEEG